MKRAFCTIREHPHYRRDAFVAGLKALGYHVSDQLPAKCTSPDDVLVIWNRYSDKERSADVFEKTGGRVVCAENGYIGADAEGRQLYAMAMGYHNGAGRWPAGDGSRWQRLGVEVKPWRAKADGQVVVFGQRGIGARQFASPPDWHNRVPKRLAAVSKRKVVVRPHPGDPANSPGVVRDTQRLIAHAFAGCIWSSGNGVRCLVEGVPVFYDAPRWICEGAAVRGIENLEKPKTDDAARQAALERMAWAQWTVDEIAAGEAFAWLLQQAAT